MNKHATDVVSLVAGLVFLAIAGMWGLLRLLHVAAPSAGWLLAAALIVMGVAGLAGAIRPHQTPPR